MGRRKLGEGDPGGTRPMATLKGNNATNYTVRIPTATAKRLETELFQRMLVSIETTGARSEASASMLIRDALEMYLDHCDAERKAAPKTVPDKMHKAT